MESCSNREPTPPQIEPPGMTLADLAVLVLGCSLAIVMPGHVNLMWILGRAGFFDWLATAGEISPTL